MKKAAKIFGIVLLVIAVLAVLIAAAAGITAATVINKATSTEQHSDLVFDIDDTTNYQKIIGKTLLNKLTNSYAEISEGNLNYLLNDIASGIAINGAEIEYLKADLQDDAGTLYAAVKLNSGVGFIDKTYPVKADFSLDYSEKLLTVRFSNITVGDIAADEDIFAALQKYVIGKYIYLPEWVAVEGAQVTVSYDCGALDKTAEEIFIANIGNDDFVNKFGDYGRALRHVPTDRLYLVIDINLKDLLIEDGKIKFNATVINVNELFYEGGAAAMDEFGTQLFI